jgi:hypothetical protein
MSSPSPVPKEDETPSQRQARLRRERRQAKLATGGTDRLKAISNISGRQMPETREDSGKELISKLNDMLQVLTYCSSYSRTNTKAISVG